MSSYLVTGGAGFIGSNVVIELVRRQQRVRVLDDLSTGRRANVAPVLGDIDFVDGDLRDLDVVRRAVEGMDYLLHLGALASVPGSIDDPLATHAVNATGTLHVLLAARDAGVDGVVLSSSCAVYGDDPPLPNVETMLPAPVSPYAASKLAGEHYARTFAEVYGLQTVSLRYFNAFGPRQDPRSQYAAVIPRFITAMLRGQRPTVFGDGGQSRDFVYVDNVVEANLLAAEALGAGQRIAGRVLNIGAGRSYTLLELMDALNDVLGTDIEPLHAPPRPGDIRHSAADITAARKLLGYGPRIDFREGLRRTVAWYRQRPVRS